jgi:hypothetical protein
MDRLKGKQKLEKRDGSAEEVAIRERKKPGIDTTPSGPGKPAVFASLHNEMR